MRTGTLQNRIEQIAPRQPILVRNLLKEFPNIHAVDMALYRMAKNGQIARFEKGIYYKPLKTRLGQLGIDKDALIEQKYLYKDGALQGYVTGPRIWNQWGLTTQLPKGTWIAMMGIRQKKVDETLDILIIKAKGVVTENAINALQFLDVLDQLHQIPDTNQEMALQKLMGIFGLRMSPLDRVEVIRQAVHYPKGVQVLAGLIAETTIKNEPYFEVLVNALKAAVCNGKKTRLEVRPEVFFGNKEWGNYYAPASKH